MDPSPPQETPLATLRDDLRETKAFMETDTYRGLQLDAKLELDDCLDKILQSTPQDIGDFFTREQSIGAARIVRINMKWFSEHCAALEQMINEREAPQDSVQQTPTNT